MSFFFSCRPPLLSRPSRIRKKKRGGGIWLSSPLLPCLPRFPFFFCFAYLASCERVRERASPAREERMSGGKLESERGMLAKRHWRRSNQHQGKKNQGKQRKKKKMGGTAFVSPPACRSSTPVLALLFAPWQSHFYALSKEREGSLNARESIAALTISNFSLVKSQFPATDDIFSFFLSLLSLFSLVRWVLLFLPLSVSSMH